MPPDATTLRYQKQRERAAAATKNAAALVISCASQGRFARPSSVGNAFCGVPLFSQAADEIAHVAMHFRGRGNNQALKRTVIDDRSRATDDIPKSRVDRPLDEIDQIGTPIERHGRAAEGHERTGAALELARQRKAAG
jgi:hypothetical protein